MEEQGIGFQVLVDGEFEVFGQMAFDVRIDCGSAEGKYRHLSSLEVLDLPVELAAEEKCKCGRGHCQNIAIGRLDGPSIESDEVAA